MAGWAEASSAAPITTATDTATGSTPRPFRSPPYASRSPPSTRRRLECTWRTALIRIDSCANLRSSGSRRRMTCVHFTQTAFTAPGSTSKSKTRLLGPSSRQRRAMRYVPEGGTMAGREYEREGAREGMQKRCMPLLCGLNVVYHHIRSVYHHIRSHSRLILSAVTSVPTAGVCY